MIWFVSLCAVENKNRPLITLMDANGRGGSFTSQSIGPCDVDLEDHSGELHDIMHDTGSYVPSTLVSTHVGQRATWQSPKGGRSHRIYYNPLPDAWRKREAQSIVDADLDVIVSRKDHLPVVIRLEIGSDVAQASVPMVKRRTALFSRSALSRSRWRIRSLSLCVASRPSNVLHMLTVTIACC